LDGGAAARPLALVVDDDGVTRQLMARLLRSWGFDVLQIRGGLQLVETMKGLIAAAAARRSEPPPQDVTAAGDATTPSRSSASGSSAAAAGADAGRAEQTVAQWPSVVCLDSSMPGMDGPPAWKAVTDAAEAAGCAKAARGVMVVGVTGNGDDFEKARFRAIGAVTLMSKPVDPEKLHQLLRPRLGESRA